MPDMQASAEDGKAALFELPPSERSTTCRRLVRAHDFLEECVAVPALGSRCQQTLPPEKHDTHR
jgi:hypothetical protein